MYRAAALKLFHIAAAHIHDCLFSFVEHAFLARTTLVHVSALRLLLSTHFSAAFGKSKTLRCPTLPVLYACKSKLNPGADVFRRPYYMFVIRYIGQTPHLSPQSTVFCPSKLQCGHRFFGSSWHSRIFPSSEGAI